MLVDKILVCGGRDFKQEIIINKVLDTFLQKYKFSCLIHGGAKGADFLAGQWAKTRGITEKVFPAIWTDRGAGIRRNTQMLIEARPELLIAFPGGNGTADMIRQAKLANLPVFCVEVLILINGEQL